MMPNTFDQLRYVAANHLECSAGDLEGVEFRDAGGQKLGDLCGVIVDPAERRVRYFVLERGNLVRRRYLLPLCPAQVTEQAGTLRAASSERAAPYLREFDTDDIAEFSDDDLIEAMFAGDRGEVSHLTAA